MRVKGSLWFPIAQSNQRPNFAFIDVENMRSGIEQALRRRGIEAEDHKFFELSRIFGLGGSDRCYVFGAVEEGKEPDSWIKSLRASSGYVFRNGTLTINGRRRKQQGVDVLLAVEALRCAYSRTMKSCTLFSGDGDLLPLVSALVDLGVFTTVVSFDDPEKSTVAAKLRDAADRFIHIGSHLLVQSIPPEHGQYTRIEGSLGDFLRDGRIVVLNVLDKTVEAIETSHDGIVAPLDHGRLSEYSLTQPIGFSAYRSIEGARLLLTLNVF